MATHFRSPVSIGPKGTGQEWVSCRMLTAAVNPSSLNTGTSEQLAVTLTGVASGDVVLPLPPSTLEAGLVVGSCWVSATDQVTVVIANVSAGTVNGASATWRFMVWRPVA